MLQISPYIGLWLLQMFVILFPMVIYQSFFQKRFINKRVQVIILTFLCGLSIIVCMTFPVSNGQYYILDFRFIPLIIAFIFGGFRVGFVLSILLICYRFMIGGTGSFLGELWMTGILLVAFRFILPRKDGWKSTARNLYPYILLTFTLIFFALGTQFLDEYKFTYHELILWGWFSFFNYLTFWMIMYLQNTIKDMELVSKKMIQFEKNHMVNQFLISISHQVLLPLQSARDSILSIQEEHLTDCQVSELCKLEMNLQSAVRSLNQYFNLMDEKQELHREWNFVKDLEEIIRLMRIYANMKQVELVYLSTAQEKISIKGEHSMIRFALMNILKNAIDASEPKGHVNISLHEMLQEVYIVIEDNGIGLQNNFLTGANHPPQSIIENTIELGLASISKIAEISGGRVEVKSKPDEGTTFSLYLPKWAL